MHICQIVVQNYGYNPEDLCNKPATKFVIRYYEASGEEVDEGFPQWLCDYHFEYAAANWKGRYEF
jgi:hypothetical protein